jgi:hypothetical protein
MSDHNVIPISRGDVFSEEAYAQGKMLDHSSWLEGDRILPRDITASDIDTVLLGKQLSFLPVVFDNNGKAILCELSRGNKEWAWLNRGQIWLYESLIRDRPHCAVLCKHNAPCSGPERRKINTRTDITSFQIMVHDHGGFVVTKVIEGNEAWQDFVFAWYLDAIRVRRRIIGFSVGLIERGE